MATRAAVLKQEIEAQLAQRIPAALSPVAQGAPRLHPTGSLSIDAMLGGGLPLGSICEATGPDGSGRSSLALSLLRQASRDAACAYVDISDALAPLSAAAAGVDMENLLWVRFTSQEAPTRAAWLTKRGGALLDSDVNHMAARGSCGSSHPRNETQGLAPALKEMLLQKEVRRLRKMEGTPGHPNQLLGLQMASQEQVDWERWNLRKVDETDPLRQMDRRAAEDARVRAASGSPPPIALPREEKLWDRLSRALRATDQVLQSGGFRVVVLDLASVTPYEATRIPSATWFRFRRAAQESDAILLLLTREPCARSSAACVLQCAVAESPKIEGVLTAVPRTAEIARQRTGPALGMKSPGRVTSWHAAPAWMQGMGS